MRIPYPSRRYARRVLSIGAAMTAATFFAQPAAAQELSHRFVNPSFGGNPFYSEHLLAIANIHRPDAPEEPEEEAPTEEELLVAQLRAQFLSQLTSEIRQRIAGAQPGESGSFDLGDQRISFVRRGDNIEITFLNTRTGEESRIVIPVSTDPFGAAPVRSASAEQALNAARAGVPGAANVGALGAGGQLSAPNVGRLVPNIGGNRGASATDADSRLLSAAPGL